MNVVLVAGGAVGLSSVLAVALEPHCEIHATPSALAAVRRVGDIAADLLVLDLGAEPLDGWIALHTTRVRWPDCRIIVTDVAREDDVRDLLALQVDRVLPRPLRVGGLLEGIVEALSLTPKWHMRSTRSSEQVSVALTYVAHHLDRPVTVDAIARSIDVSPSRLARAFRDATGISVKEYLTRVRVDATRRALGETAEALASIASACGFCDASHLSRTFRRYTGQRPTEYRRALGRLGS